MTGRTKYLSYSWNAGSSPGQNKKILPRPNQGWLYILGHLFFSFSIIICASFGLRYAEAIITRGDNSFKNILSAKIALAAEIVYKAELASQSPQSIYIKPNEAITITLQYKNIGNADWGKKTVFIKTLTSAWKYNHNWQDMYRPAQLQEETVEPGSTATFKFAVRAPKNLGAYTGDFMIINDNTAVDASETGITLNVVENPENYNKPASAPAIKNICTLKLNIASVENALDNTTCYGKFNIPTKGPDIRVGIFPTTQAVTLKNNAAWQIYDQNDLLLASVPAETEIRLFYSMTKKGFSFDFIDRTVRTSSLTLKLKNFQNGIYTVTSYTDIAKWNKSINYNQFKGDLELTYYAPKERVWLIETLALEEYLKGIKETSNEDPTEYQRAMTIAARSYALYHINKFEKQESFFDVYNDERDQVYKGFSAEQIMPNQSTIVGETSGVVVTYSDELVLAFYSARSGGQTLNYKNIPYLKAVDAPYSKTLGKWGHGIGIDAYDAKTRANKLGWTYDQILKYYYTGINIEKIY